MLRSIPARLFKEWEAYAELEPFGEVRADLRIARLEQTVRALFGDKATLMDCLLPFPEEDDEQQQEEAPAPRTKDWREIKAAGQAWADLSAKAHFPIEPEATHS